MADTFKSELDWSPESWLNKRRGTDSNGNLYTDKDVQSLNSHIPEYLQIEEDSKRNGRWLKMPDGSEWTGDPRAWIMMQSNAFKKNYSSQPWYTGQFGEDVNTSRFHNGTMWFSVDPGLGGYYADIIDPTMLSSRFEPTTLREMLINFGVLPKESLDSNYTFKFLDKEITPYKDIEGYNFLTAIPKRGNYRTAPELPYSGGGGYFWTKLPYSFDGYNIRYNPDAKVKTDDVVDWSRELGDDGIFINDVWDGPTRDYHLTNEEINAAIIKSRERGYPTGFGLRYGQAVKEFISQPGFTRFLKFIEGNNGDFDINNPDKYAYENNQQQDTYYAKQGIKLIPKKRYIK